MRPAAERSGRAPGSATVVAHLAHQDYVGGLGSVASALAPLDLHKAIGQTQAQSQVQTPEEAWCGCPRWPEDLRLESTLGQLVPGRCKATNLCVHCARLAAIENAEILALDAMGNCAPAVWSVTGTRTATFDVGRFKDARHRMRDTVKERWPAAEAATLIEFTTGYGTHAGGERRPHWNDLWKGIPAEDADELQERVAWVWCKYVDAEPRAQYADTVGNAGGLMRYLALHFQKESQAPPIGWRGHRFRTTRGYLAQPMAQAREQARASLRLKRELWKAHNAGLEGQAAEDAAQRALYELDELAWTLVRLVDVPTDFGSKGDPAAWETMVVPVERSGGRRRAAGAQRGRQDHRTTSRARNGRMDDARAASGRLQLGGNGPSPLTSPTPSEPCAMVSKPRSGLAPEDTGCRSQAEPAPQFEDRRARRALTDSAEGLPRSEIPDVKAPPAQANLSHPTAVVRRDPRRSSAALSGAVARSPHAAGPAVPGGGVRAGP